MNNTAKNIIYSIVLLTLIAVVYLYRETQRPVQMEITGETMGTTFNIKYLDSQARRFQKEVDELLIDFNQALSTYIPDSEISRFNQGMKIELDSPFFYPVLLKSKEVYKISEGAFDPTVAPLVNAWGFGFKTEKFPDSARVDSLRKLVGFNKIIFDNKTLQKSQKGVMLDFNAIAQGYGVDVVAALMEENGIKDYMIEIGGEVLCKGRNSEGKVWTIGINNPKNPEQIQAVVALDNRALATSGNYRKTYIRDGKRYAHTINPKSGYPVFHSLISATVFAPDAMTADAYATTFMVLGLEKAKEMTTNNKDLDVYLVYTNGKGELETYISPGIKPSITE